MLVFASFFTKQEILPNDFVNLGIYMLLMLLRHYFYAMLSLPYSFFFCWS
jgi:hypothetical protein